jgi:hypothetical protein
MHSAGRAALLILATLSVLLPWPAGCGGTTGGGDGGGGDGGGLDLGMFTPGGDGSGGSSVVGGETSGVLTAAPAELDFGSDLAQLDCTLSNSAQDELRFTLSDDADWLTVAADADLVGPGESTVLHATADRGALDVGDYTATITVAVDGAAVESIPVRMNVPEGGAASARLQVTVTELDFSTAAESRSLIVRVRGGVVTPYAATADQPWISLVNPEGSSGGQYRTIGVRVSRDGLAPGDYAGTVTVATPDEQATVAVRMQVVAAAPSGGGTPQLWVSRSDLDFGTTRTRLAFIVRNAGDGLLRYTISSSAAWATVTVPAGDSDGEYDSVTVFVYRTGLDAGDHAATITVAGDNGQSHQIAVRMSVAGTAAPPAALQVSTGLLDFGTLANTLLFTARNTGSGTLSYTIATDVGWCTATPNEGASSGEVDTIEVRAVRAGLGPGAYTATVTIATAEGETIDIDVLMQVTDPFNPPPPPVVSPWPTSDERVDSVANLYHYAVRGIGAGYGYDPFWWASSPIAANCAIREPGDQGPYFWNLLLTHLAQENPYCQAASAISGTLCKREATIDRYPANTIAYESMPEWAFLYGFEEENGWARLDQTNPAATALMADRIVQEVLSRPLAHAVFIDNMAHPGTGGTRAPWSSVCEYLRNIKLRLNEQNIKTIVNLACQPYFLAGADADLFATAVDGMNFEQPFHWVLVRPYPDRVAAEIEVYRRWLDAGKHLELMAAHSAIVRIRELQRYEEHVLAGMAMMIRRPGDSICVPRVFWEPPPNWGFYPITLGQPLADYTMSGAPPVLTREFEHGTLHVDLGASMDATRAMNAVTVEWRE